MSSENVSNPNKELVKYINIFCNEITKENYVKQRYLNDELEIRFGTNWRHPITRNNFENTIRKIKSSGWKLMSGVEKDFLRIQTEYYSEVQGKRQINNIRTELQSMNTVQKYCKTNSLPSQELKSNRIKFLKKTTKLHEESGIKNKLFPIDYHDFEFRVNYKEESSMNLKSNQVKNMLQDWNTSKKVFRLIKRYTFLHQEFPFKIDCSIVKSSNKKNGYLIPTWNVHESNVFKNNETYEIEIEFDSERVSRNLRAGHEKVDYVKTLYKNSRGVIKLILSGLQETNFPISFSEIRLVRKQYLSLVYYGENPPEVKEIHSKYFIGPSSISLEMINVQKKDETISSSTILEPYTVTDKADGKRKLMFINKEGKIYLIDTNMNVQFTGCITKHKENYNCIIDGEHVETDKEGEFINNYLAFDIYVKNRKDLRAYPFLPINDKGFEFSDKNMDITISRYGKLTKFIKNLDPQSIINKAKPSMIFKHKNFYDNLNDENIFDKCKIILDQAKNELFNYEIDGLIFTPAFLGVGSDKIGKAGPKNKITWHSSFKWKPPEFNTIDFLVTTKKDEFGNEIIKNQINTGTDMVGSTQMKTTKTIELRVGWNPNKHGYVDPINDLLNDNLPEKKWGNYNEDDYRAEVFKPTNPTPDWKVYEQEMELHVGSGNSDKGVMMTEEGDEEPFEDNTIVEFYWDKYYSPTNSISGKFIPIRVRHDKTSEFRKGRKNYGNAYHVANSVWKSIHNPVTERMITTGIDIPENSENETIYYKNKEKSDVAERLRHFHNKYVKRKLILGVCKAGDNLIDLTVGKGGDLHKWMKAKLNFVLGLDIHSDNIDNRQNGAAARYLDMCKQYKIETLPKVLYAVADSGLNILSGEAMMGNYKYKQVVNYVFGNINESDPSVGKGVLKSVNIGQNKFDVVSNQFSIHYFFENLTKVHNFARNVCETCKVSGYFIGTTYDGEKVFKKLKELDEGEFLTIMKDGKKMWEIAKMYDKEEFPSDENSLGYPIDVYQESINKYFTEYLVNFDYFIQLMKVYGFDVISKDEANQMGFNSGIGPFKELYTQMNDEINNKTLKKKEIGLSNKMNTDEKSISFLNKYFIFQKKRDVDANNIFNMFVNKSIHKKFEEEREQEEDSPVKIPIKRKVKKLKTKFKMPK